jgi:hypothetical protein
MQHRPSMQQRFYLASSSSPLPRPPPPPPSLPSSFTTHPPPPPSPRTSSELTGEEKAQKKKSATQEVEHGTHCGDTHPAVSAGAPAILEFGGGVFVVNDAKLREQLFYAVTHQAELIGSITYIDEKMRTGGLSGPLQDLFESPLSELLAELKSHQEMISVLTEWAAQAGLHIPSGSNPTVQEGTGDTHPTAQEGTDDLHTTDTCHRGDTHPTGQGRTLCLPSSSSLVSTPPSYFPTISSIMKHYNAACVFNHETHQWSVPVTPHLDLEDDFHWSKMLDFGLDFPPGHSIVSKAPTFYLDEPDANQQNRPRLDILISFHNGATVRYHPKADLIWSWTQQPTRAMQKRYNLGTNLERKLARARR